MKSIILRISGIIPLLLIVSFLAFILVRLAPGGPFDAERSFASEEIKKVVEAQYHLDKSIGLQYLYYLGDLIRGDFGLSMKYKNHSVSDIIRQGLPVSMILGSMAFVFSVSVGIGMGILIAWKRDKKLGQLTNLVGLFFICVPSMVLGPLLILLFAIYIPIFPTSFLHSPWHAVLPVLTLSVYYSGKIGRLVSEGISEALNSDYIRTAFSKGIPSHIVLFRHALPSGLLPVISYSGPLLADLLTGSFIVENLFQIPGLGTFLVNSSLNRDHTMIIGLVLVYSFLIISFNIAVDLLYKKVDPRLS